MNSKLKLCDYIESPNALFDPIPTYSGEWSFIDMSCAHVMTDVLNKNAKIVNGMNLYEKFIQDKYYRNMTEFFGSKNLAINFPPIITSLPDSSGYGRSFYYSIVPFLAAFQLEGLDSNLYENSNNEVLLSSLRDDLRNKRKTYSSVKEDGEKSPFHDRVLSEYKGFSQSMSLSNFIEMRISAFTNIIYGIRYIKDFFEKPINTDEFASCFDLDVLYLCAAKSTIETSKIAEISEKLLSNTIMLAVKYNETLENVKKMDNDYTCKIQWPVLMPNGAVVYKTYSTEDFVRECNELLLRHPEFKCHKIPAPSGDIERQFKDQDWMETFVKDLANAFKAKELSASWEIVKPGHILTVESEPDEEKPEDINDTITPIDRELLTIEEKRRLLIKRKGYLDSTPYVYEIRGLNSFEGYIGFIYMNGKVVFEKFYKNTTNYEPAENEATYVMSFDKFVDLSKLSKTEIIEHIKNMGNEDVTRVYHTKNWKNKVSRTIEGADYSEKVMTYIQQLLNSNTISKIEGEKTHD